MRTVTITDTKVVEVLDVPEPTLIDSGSAIVRVERTAICGSDLHFYEGDLPMYPVAVGHEAIGTVVEVGSDVRRIRTGDRVLVASVAGCGNCVGCATLDPVACVNGARVFGSGVGLDAAQAELIGVPAADFQLLVIPEGITDDAALLLTDNLGTGWAGAARCDADAGETVLVLGLGAVGQCAVRSALAQDLHVLAYDPVPGRVDLAVASGAVALEGDDPVAATLEVTKGRGAAAVIDAVGHNATIDTAFGAVRSTGTVSVIGLHNLEPYPLGVLMGVFRSITLRMTTAPVHQSWRDLVPLIQEGRLDTEGIFTHTFALDDAATAYATVAERRPDCLKVRLTP